MKKMATTAIHWIVLMSLIDPDAADIGRRCNIYNKSRQQFILIKQTDNVDVFLSLFSSLFKESRVDLVLLRVTAGNNRPLPPIEISKLLGVSYSLARSLT